MRPSTRSRTIARLAAGGAALCAAAASVLTFAGGAGALTQARVTATPGEPVVTQYGPLTAGGIGTTADTQTFAHPDVCPTSTYCDAIPITVDPVGLDDAEEEWFVRITTSWSTEVVATPLLGDVSVNDLDTYLFNDPVDPEAGPDHDGIVGSGATGSQPEVIVLRNPPRSDYTLIVSNYNGVNSGYTVTIEFDVQPYPDVFESLPPEVAAPVSPSRPAAAASPRPVVRPPAPPSFAGVPDPAFEPPPPPLVDLSLGGAPVADAAFDSGFDDIPSFEDELAGAEAIATDSGSVAERILAPPSTVALVLWLVALPLAFLAFFAGALSRKQRAARELPV